MPSKKFDSIEADLQNFQAEQSREIFHAYTNLIKEVSPIPFSSRIIKVLDGTGGKVSVADLISYQIGWGKLLISWYESGLKKEAIQMPGEGFFTWKYVEMAKYFSQKYPFDCYSSQEKVFNEVVTRILAFVEHEHNTDHLHEIGRWPWCKKWPLSKWVQVNTISPYKRASLLIRKYNKTKSMQFE